MEDSSRNRESLVQFDSRLRNKGTIIQLRRFHRQCLGLSGVGVSVAFETRSDGSTFSETSMMNKVTLADLSVRVEKLERAVFHRDRKSRPKAGEFSGATGGVRFLVSKGFFSSKRSFGEVKKALGDNSYHYSKQAVQGSLNNLSKTGGLLVSVREQGKKLYAKRK